MNKTYSAEGLRLRDYSDTAIARLLALRRVVLTRSTKGRLLHVTFLPHDGSKVLKTARMGQKYSVAESLGNGQHSWKHSDLPKLHHRHPMLQIELERELQRIFRRVCLDCLSPETPPPSNVVAIDSKRRPRRVLPRAERLAA
jgi:hypothetical protein